VWLAQNEVDNHTGLPLNTCIPKTSTPQVYLPLKTSNRNSPLAAKHGLHPSKRQIELISAFSLIELLVVIAVIAVLASLAGPVMSSLTRAGSITRTATDLSLTLEQARVFAMANNTYVWFALKENAASQQVSCAVVAGVNGQKSDIQTPGGYKMISRTKTFENTKLLPKNHAEPLAGMSPNVADIIDSTMSNISIDSGGQNQVYQKVIQFGPTGEAAIGSASQARWVQFGIDSVNGGGDNYAILQVSGLTGQVRVFRP